MRNQVRVRLVPKSREDRSITMDLGGITPHTAALFSPDPGRASAALASAFSLTLDAKLNQHQSVEATVPSERFAEVFGCELTEVLRETSEYLHPAQERQAYLAPRGELKVPESMRNTIAFAYVPTPPQFYAASFIPPNTELYHLRLGEVRNALRASRCHRRGWTGRGIRIAMADSGFSNHPYFERQGYNITRVHTPSTSNPLVDTKGHGTGESANTLIIAPDCHFIGVKHDDYSAQALETCMDQNPQVMTNSWGWDVDHMSMEMVRNNDPNLFNELRDVRRIIGDAISKGIIMLFSAGNGHKPFPASLPEVIAVGGVTVLPDGDLEASSYSSSFVSSLYPGREVPDLCGVVGSSGKRPLEGHIMLPVPEGSDLEGENLPSGVNPKGWGIFSGTSAASPQVAGVVALLLAVNPDLQLTEIRSILVSTATDVVKGSTALGDKAGPGQDLATGVGLINAFEACTLAVQLRGDAEEF